MAVAALLALGVAACGGDDSTTTATPGGGEAATRDGGSGSQGGSAGGGGSKAADGGKGGAATTGGGDSSKAGSKLKAAPLKVSGGGAGQFRVKGGDNSIQSWGEESDESQLDAAAEAVHGFYVARANEDWAAACTYLARSLVKQLEQFAAQAEDAPPPDCATLLEALTRHPLPAAVRRESTIVDAGSLRVGEESSFLIYRGAERTVYAMPLEDEDGAWKLTLLSATPLG